MEIGASSKKKPVYNNELGVIKKEDYIEYKTADCTSKINKKNKEIVVLDQRSLEFDNYATKLINLKSATNALRGAPLISADYHENVFAKNVISITSSSAGVSGENFLTVDPSDYITPGIYKIRVMNLATAKSHTYRGFSSDKIDVVTSEPGFFSPGSFTINDKVVNIMPGDNLRDISTKINNIGSESNILSRIVKKTNTEYLLILSSKEVGVQNSFNIIDQDNILAQLSLTIQDAQDAKLYFDDILIERSTNTINDFDESIKLKITLVLASGDVDIYIQSQPDKEEVVKSIVNFIDNYNDVQRYIYKQNERNSQNNTLKSTAILGNNREFIASSIELLELIRHKVHSDTPLKFSKIENLGLEIKDYKGSSREGDTPIKNAIQFQDNSGKLLTNNIRSNIDDVRKLFAFDYKSSSSSLVITHTTNKIKINNFIVDIDINRPHVAVAEGMAQDKVRIIIDGQIYRPFFKSGQIIAPPNSPIDGMKLYYKGKDVDVINVSMTQGIADRFYNYLSWFLVDENYISSGNQVEDLSNGTRKYDIDGNVVQKSVKTQGGIVLIKEGIKTEQTIKEQELKNLQEKLDNKKEFLNSDFSKKEARRKKLENTLKNIEDQFTAQYSKK